MQLQPKKDKILLKDGLPILASGIKAYQKLNLIQNNNEKFI